MSARLSNGNWLGVAIFASVALHAGILAVHFAAPERPKRHSPDDGLEVILVNAKSHTRPVKPTAIAQADLNGGGESERGRATSFLMRSPKPADGEVAPQLSATRARLEAEQKRLLAAVTETPLALPDANVSTAAPSEAHDAPIDLSTLRQIARMEAQVDKEISDYNARPRRGFIGPNTRGASYALYYREWKDKVERIGTNNYPEEARGRIYGDLTLTVVLNPDGSIYNDEIHITRSSGFPVLDRAAKRIVRMAAPYGRFSDEMRRDYDVFEITSRFSFTRGDGFEARFDK